MSPSSWQRVAHRGGSLLAPENTLGAFRRALHYEIDAVECDVQLSKDGHVLVFHDAVVDRLTEGTGNLLDLDYSTLRSLNAAAHFPDPWSQRERIPTLSELLNLAYQRKKVYIELKSSQRGDSYGQYPQLVEKVLADIFQAQMQDQVLIIAFDWQLLREVKQFAPQIQIGALVDKTRWQLFASSQPAQFIQSIQEMGCSWLNLDQQLCTPEIVAQVHEHGCKLGLWTVNTLEGMNHFTALGVDSLTSDRPDLLASV